MPRVRYLGGGGYHIRDGPDFDSEGDEADVGERTAERLTSRADFERVTADGEAAGDDADATGDGEDEAGFDADEWLDQGYQTRADRVAAGDVDAHLDAIESAETSETVLETIDERRSELEG